MDKKEISNLIRELIEKTLITVSDISVLEEVDGTTWFAVEVSNPHPFVSREGEALLALNHLIRRIVEMKYSLTAGEDAQEPASHRVLVDINGFQKNKIEAIKATAHMMAERARYFKSSIEVDPMTPFERRIVHEFLSKEADLKTESTGDGRARRVVIRYIGLP